jgi:hypothetical protein
MMSLNRPACLLASLAAAAPAFAFTPPAGSGDLVGGAPGWSIGSVLQPMPIMLAAMLLLGGTLVVLNRRPNWRLVAVAIVGGCALLGGDALLDGASTAIAVSP